MIIGAPVSGSVVNLAEHHGRARLMFSQTLKTLLVISSSSRESFLSLGLPQITKGCPKTIRLDSTHWGSCIVCSFGSSIPGKLSWLAIEKV